MAPQRGPGFIREGSLRDPTNSPSTLTFSIPFKMGQLWLGTAEWPVIPPLWRQRPETSLGSTLRLPSPREKQEASQ